MEIVKFITRECGNTPEEALERAVIVFQADFGCSGYTGTIADKKDSEIRIFTIDHSETLLDTIDDILDQYLVGSDSPIGCINLEDGEYVFFGWAEKK